MLARSVRLGGLLAERPERKDLAVRGLSNYQYHFEF